MSDQLVYCAQNKRQISDAGHNIGRESNIPSVVDANGQPYTFHRQSSFRKNNIIYTPQPKEAAIHAPHEKSCVALEKEFDTYDKRLKSFANYPTTANARPEDLAQNGLFYVGVGDKAKCAYCKGQLYNWEPTDVPLEEHNRHFPDCDFIKVRYQRLKEISINNEIPGDFPISTKLLNPTENHDQHYIIQGHNKENLAIKIVHQMGYDENLIHEAFGILSKKGVKLIKSADLLDALFELEERDRQTSEENKNSSSNEGATVGENNTCVSLLKSTVDDLSLKPSLVQQEKKPQHANLLLNSVQNNVQVGSKEGEIKFANGDTSISTKSPGISPSIIKCHPFATSQHTEGLSSNSLFTGNYNDDRNQLLRIKQLNVLQINHSQNPIEVGDGGDANVECDTEGCSCLGHVAIGKDNESQYETDDLNVFRSKCMSPNPVKSSAKVGSKNSADPNVIKKLREQKTKLKENVICNVCRKNKINTLFLPCRHLVSCEFCAAELSDCSRCSKKIIGTVKIFMI